MFKQSSGQKWVLAVVLLALLLLGVGYGIILKPHVLGLLYDDGMYWMAANALHHGQGYRLDGVAGHPWLYKYPPLYPLLLSGLMSLFPVQPDFAFLYKGVNIILCLIFLGLLFYYCRRFQGLSVGLSLFVMLAMGTNARFAEIATEVMSEPLFISLSLLALTVMERIRAARQPPRPMMLLVLVVLGVAAFYTRSLGLLLIMALTLSLALAGYLRQAAVYGLVSLLALVPWLLWVSAQPQKTERLGMFLIRTFQESYWQSFRYDLAEEGSFLTLYGKGFSELVEKLSVQFLPPLEWFYLGPETSLSKGIILGLSFLLIAGLGWRAFRRLQNRQWSATGIYTALYLLVLPLWGYYLQYPRFLLCVLPFLWVTLVKVIRDSSWGHRLRIVGMLALVVGVLGSNIVHGFPYLRKTSPNSLLIHNQRYPAGLWPAYRDIAGYLKTKTPSGSIVFAETGADIYFYGVNAQRPIVDSCVFLPRAALDRSCPDRDKACLTRLTQARAKSLKTFWCRHYVAYVVENHFAVLKNNYNPGRLSQKPDGFPVALLRQAEPDLLTQVAQSREGEIAVYRLNAKKCPVAIDTPQKN